MIDAGALPDAGPATDGGLTPDANPPANDASTYDGSTLDAAPPGDDAGAAGNLDWNLATAGPVNADVAIVTNNYPSSSPTDAIFVAAVSGTPNFYALTNIYAATPTKSWTATTLGGVNGSAVETSADGSKVYTIDTSNHIYCFVATNGAACPNWAGQFQFVATATIGRSAMWIDYAANAAYWGDTSGVLYKLGLDHPGNQLYWTYKVGTAAINSSPIELNGYVYVGDDAGNMYRIQDPGSTTPTNVSVYSACSGRCSGSPQVSDPTADSAAGLVFFAGNGSLFQFPLGAGPWTPTGTLSLNMPAAQNSSPPAVDGAGTLYVGYYNALFRAPYPFTSAPPVGATLYGKGSPTTSPKSGPTIFNGSLYIGDATGMAELFSCPGRVSAPAFSATTTVYGSTVDSTPLVDYVNGNVVFGYTNGAAGGLVQITQAGGWGCGSQAACASAGCGTGSVCEPAMGCVPDTIPPSVPFASGGGGVATAGLGSLEMSFGGFTGSGQSAGGATLWIGALPAEGF